MINVKSSDLYRFRDAIQQYDCYGTMQVLSF